LPRSSGDQPPAQDDAALPPAQALAVAQELLESGRPFHAHEVFEAVWKAGPTPAGERDMWQGLAQIAVGLTHALRGNSRGAVTLLRRGVDRLVGYPSPGPHDVDIEGIRQQSLALADTIEATGTAGVGADLAAIRLRTDSSAPRAS
jgi:hypothetical protein